MSHHRLEKVRASIICMGGSRAVWRPGISQSGEWLLGGAMAFVTVCQSAFLKNKTIPFRVGLRNFENAQSWQLVKTNTVKISPVHYSIYLSWPCCTVLHMATTRILYCVRLFTFGHGEIRLYPLLPKFLHVGNTLYIMLDLLIFDGIIFKCA